MSSRPSSSGPGSLGEEIEDYLKVLQQSLAEINANFEHTSAWKGDGVQDVEEEIIIQSIENQFSTWMSWFYNTIVYLLTINVFFFTYIIDPRFEPVPVILIALFPFYLWWAFLNSIPVIEVNAEVIFSRKYLTLSRQFQLGRYLFTYFSKEMIKNSPFGATILTIAAAIFSLVMINELIF